MMVDHRQSPTAEHARRIERLVRERLIQIAFDNARFALIPLSVSVFCYSVLMANVVPYRQLAVWVLIMLCLLGFRGWLNAAYNRAADKTQHRWVEFQAATMAGLGLVYGITPLWIELPAEAWLLAVVNLWLGGLAVAAIMGQGIFLVLGLSFAIPVLTPLILKWYFGPGPMWSLLGFGNTLFFLYLFSVVRRAQRFTIGEIRHRIAYEMMAESFAAERLQTEQLVTKLTREIARRKKVQTALKNARDNARQLAAFDHVTNLANQRTLERQLQREWVISQRERRPISLVLCGVDRFQAYNERYGYHAGDLCLARLAEVVRAASAREGDLAARFGVHGFAVLLPETGEYAALDIAESIRSAVFERTILHGASDVERVVTVSCGVATIIPDHSARAQDLIETAAVALHRAKKAGRNCVYTVYGSAASDER